MGQSVSFSYVWKFTMVLIWYEEILSCHNETRPCSERIVFHGHEKGKDEGCPDSKHEPSVVSIEKKKAPRARAPKATAEVVGETYAS